ncbi:hypothetical protein PCANC_07291 [Puccinia coronata f. sp. avenae]|uniref:Uncharacterized protein n=1 Tax=Puccinia coronata f. sp. avenae TaxID=200324 RepID=A0A2N5VS21_9BASI|nr:hypothetical protein PCANC_07291 [Puccinia coronata f. sp. avenae]
MDKYGCNSKALAIRNLYDKTKPIRIKRDCLFLHWSTMRLGWTLITPHSNFPLELYVIATKTEIATSRLPGDAKQDDALSTPQKTGADKTTEASLTGSHKKAPGNPLAGAQKKGPSDPNGSPVRKYTLARKLPNGQWLAPCQIPRSKKDHTPALKDLPGQSCDDPVVLNVDWSNPASPVGHDGLATPNAAGDLPLESKDDSSGNNQLEHAGHSKNPPPPGGATLQLSPLLGDMSFTLPPAGASALINQSPARKVHQSPACVDREFSRLNFSSRQGGRGDNCGSPTRKAPGSSWGGSSMQSVSGPAASPSVSPSLFSSTSRRFPPLTAKGLIMTLDQFLTHARFDLDDQVVRVLISMNQIQHWGYFRHSSVGKLRKKGFPKPIAVQLMYGVALLKVSLEEENISYSYEV